MPAENSGNHRMISMRSSILLTYINEERRAAILMDS
jgi:hypothetical protein